MGSGVPGALVRPARRTLKDRGFSEEFVNWGGLRFFRPLLYRLSYLGGTLILFGKSRTTERLDGQWCSELLRARRRPGARRSRAGAPDTPRQRASRRAHHFPRCRSVSIEKSSV